MALQTTDIPAPDRETARGTRWLEVAAIDPVGDDRRKVCYEGGDAGDCTGVRGQDYTSNTGSSRSPGT